MEENNNQDFTPVMSPHKEYGEIKPYVVFWGLFYAAVFALAIGYLCLKIAQTIDAFAPVSIMAMGMAMMLKRKDPFPENVHIQAIASAGTNSLGGAMFILPAFYILKIQMSFVTMVIPIILGSVLGVLMSVIFRRYFCVDMHKEYPFPAGRAAVGVLTSNSGASASLMIISGLAGFFYSVAASAFGYWSNTIETMTFSWGEKLASSHRLVFALDTEPALIGIGYYTGLRYAAIICAGSFFSWFVCIPIVYYIGGDHLLAVGDKMVAIKDMPVGHMFKNYVRYVGIGMLATGGVIGLLKMAGVVKKVFGTAIKETFSAKQLSNPVVLRTEQDISMKTIVVGMAGIMLLFGIAFHFICAHTLLQTILAVVIVIVFTFMLSVVGISSIAYTGSEPISGMTIFMLMVASIIMMSVGLSGKPGIVAVLFMSAFLGSTLGMAGNFMSEMKVAHLTGATPKKMQQWQIVAAVMVSVLSVAIVIMLNKAYGFTGPKAPAAPQANMFATMSQAFMEKGGVHMPLMMAGAFFALLLWMVNVPVLAFALGAYLPMEINVPLLVGALVGWLVQNSTKDKALGEERYKRGEIVSSGLVAGGALGGLATALITISGRNWMHEAWAKTPAATYITIAVYLGMCALVWAMSVKGKKEAKA